MFTGARQLFHPDACCFPLRADLLYKDYNTHQKFSLTTSSPNGVVSAPSLLINHHFLLYLSAPPQRTPHFICVVLSGVNHYESDSFRTCHLPNRWNHQACQIDRSNRLPLLVLCRESSSLAITAYC
jgi:hypothetical protein